MTDRRKIDTRIRGAAVVALLALAAPATGQDQPYAGQEGREIASLSESDVAALLAGEGWGLALPAELNGYPGPAHVLDLAEQLALTGSQRAEVQAIFDEMKTEAQAVGAEYVAAEAHVSRMFALGHASPGMLEASLATSSDALARLRGVHLAAHLATTPILTGDQREMYAQLRGYDGESGGHGGHAGHGDH